MSSRANRNTEAPNPARQAEIDHLRWKAKAVANLLSAVHMLPRAEQQCTLDTANTLAIELHFELDAFTNGAA